MNFKIYALLILVPIIVSCSKSNDEKLLISNAWVNELRGFSMIRFTDDGYGYDLVNLADTLDYKFEDKTFHLIDKKGDSTKTLIFDVIKLDQDSFVVQVNQKEEGIRLRYRKAQLKDLIYGGWKNNEITYQFLAPDSIGSGINFNNLNKDMKFFFGYHISNNSIKITQDSITTEYDFSFDKSFHNLLLKSKNRELHLSRTKFHDN